MTVADRIDTPTQLLGGGRVVTPGGVLSDAWVRVSEGRIAAVASARPAADVPIVDLRGAWLLPGYIDLHMHGGGGHDVSDSLQAMEQAVAFHRTHGTTATLVSLMTAPEAALSEQLGWAADLVRRGASRRGHVLGSHLEGPFLSERRCGAQNAAHMTAPDAALLERLLAAAGDSLRMVTLAPELPGALALIETLANAGVIAAMGHSDASYEQALQGIRAGARHATHLFNAMPPLLHRDPGLVGAALESGITCELINDGRHVHPAIIRLVFDLIDSPALVTDAIDATGAGDGRFELGGQEVVVQDGEARLAATGSLSGSTLTMDQALRNTVKASGLSVERASAAASAVPARALGLEHELGAIAPGMCADLVVLDDDLQVIGVMGAGLWCELETA
ncbi:MAG TPA: N-acetylglucosamine-6-phosphate deacetylase [Solirubrobacteraceae bacterium]|nr:N-acetylglucosamine-6-phosphate deacetylase [Solirubrobacteraceae bacterium]